MALQNGVGYAEGESVSRLLLKNANQIQIERDLYQFIALQIGQTVNAHSEVEVIPDNPPRRFLRRQEG